jgi:hypothetical protein
VAIPISSVRLAPSLRSVAVLTVLQRDDVAGGPAGKQRADQLRGHGVVALRTLIPLKPVSERMCVGNREAAS